MNPELVLKMVDLAISLAQTQMDSGGATQALLATIRKGVQAYEHHTGGPLDPSLIKAEEPV
jgi:hypothetical protein